MKAYSCIFLLLISLAYSCKTHKGVTITKHGDQLLIKTTQSSGNSSNLSGTVTLIGTAADIEANKNISLPYANIQLTKNGKSFNLAADIARGNFGIENIAPGQYALSISYPGCKALETSITIKKASNIKIEAKILSNPAVEEKPVIYLYPTQKQDISVVLNYDGKLLHTYPAYPENGWKVSAEPNGTLWDEKGQEYYALFWEGRPKTQLAAKDGFIVAGKNTAAFLEEKLAYLGLNRREANEFIMYWLPRMENNAYNLIHFAGTDYEKSAELKITPQPETSIRIMMLTQGLQTKVDFPLQDLSPLKKTRKGFTVVEWGGTVVNSIDEGI